MPISKRLGYRLVERNKPSFQEWLKENGHDDARNELYYHQNIGPNALARRRSNGWASRQARGRSKKLLSESLRQRRLYEEAIESGAVETVRDYVPLDMTDPADQAYYRVQLKRAERGMELIKEDEDV